MKLDAITFNSVRSVPDGRFELTAGGPLVVTGGAASGKTTFLEAILAAVGASLPGALPVSDAWLGKGKTSGSITIEWSLTPAEQVRARAESERITTTCPIGGEPGIVEVSLRMREEIEAFPVEYFDAGRSLAAQHAADVPKRADVGRAIRPRGKYAWVREYLLTLGRSDEAGDHVRRFRHGLSLLAPNLDWVGSRGRPGSRDVDCVFARPDGEERRLEELSGSERMGVLVGATLAALPFEEGLLLIDSPELQIPREDEESFAYALTLLAPKAQAVIATTSLAIVAKCAPGRVVRLHGTTKRVGEPASELAAVPKERTAELPAPQPPRMAPVSTQATPRQFPLPSFLIEEQRLHAAALVSKAAEEPKGQDGVETMFAAAPAESPPLPFVAGAAKPPPAAPRVAFEEASTDAGETVGFVALPGPPAPATPFEEPAGRSGAPVRSAGVDLSLFPLESFAAISSALARGEDRKLLLAKHHLSESVFAALSSAWGDRMEREPALLAHFTDLARQGAAPRKPST